MKEKDFISSWISALNTEPIKNFPDDFAAEVETKTYTLPRKGLLIGKEFFGEYELLNTEGDEVLKVGSYERAKFFVYANRNKPGSFSVPIDDSAVKEVISRYEKYLDSIIKKIEQDCRKNFPGSKNTNELLSEIFKHLNLIRLK